jgi:hypothetical protein
MPKIIYIVEWVRKGVLRRFFFPGPLRDGTEWKVDATFKVHTTVQSLSTYRDKALAGKGKGVIGGSVGRCRKAG